MRWTTVLKIAAGVIVIIVFVVIFTSEAPHRTTKQAAISENGYRGNIGQYLYSITTAGQNKKLAQFDPSLPADEDKVLDALKAVAKAGFNLDIAAQAQPVVVARDEKNYVTFKALGKTAFFELYKNASGELGTVRFWVED